MTPRCYALVVGTTIVAKRAIGPNPDGQFPDPPSGAVPISLADYRQVRPGWQYQDGACLPPTTTTSEAPEEFRARIHTTLVMAADRISTLDTHLQSVADLVETLRTQAIAAKAALTALTARVAALEAQVR